MLFDGRVKALVKRGIATFRPVVRPFVRLFVPLFVPLSVPLSDRSFVRLSACSSVCLSARPLARSPACLRAAPAPDCLFQSRYSLIRRSAVVFIIP